MLPGSLARFAPLVLVVGALALGAPTSARSDDRARAGVRHTKLLRSTPAAGAVVPSAPQSLTLWFSKPVQARLTRVQLADGAGTAVALESPRTTDQGDTVVVAAVKAPLAPGSFTVTWATTSRDSHVIKGSFRFTVRSASVGTDAR